LTEGEGGGYKQTYTLQNYKTAVVRFDLHITAVAIVNYNFFIQHLRWITRTLLKSVLS